MRRLMHTMIYIGDARDQSFFGFLIDRKEMKKKEEMKATKENKIRLKLKAQLTHLTFERLGCVKAMVIRHNFCFFFFFILCA